MPVKKDDTGKRWVEMELIAPGTPEQVWQAIATGPGYTVWFTPTTIEERIGGAIRFDMDPNGESKGEVTVWEPPLRFHVLGQPGKAQLLVHAFEFHFCGL